MQGTSEGDQANTIFKLLGTPTEHSWPRFGSLPAVQSGLYPLVDLTTISLGADGELIKMPKSSLRKKFPAEGIAQHVPPPPPPAGIGAPPPPSPIATKGTTPLSESGFQLLSALLACDPSARISASAALEHSWLSTPPLPQPLSRLTIRELRRNRDEAITSGAHMQASARAALARASTPPLTPRPLAPPPRARPLALALVATRPPLLRSPNPARRQSHSSACRPQARSPPSTPPPSQPTYARGWASAPKGPGARLCRRSMRAVVRQLSVRPSGPLRGRAPRPRRLS